MLWHTALRRLKCLSLVFASSMALAACGLGTSNQDRLDRAASAFEEGDIAGVIIDARSVLQSEPGNKDARVILGRALLVSGDGATAEKEFMRALDLGVPLSEVAVELGEALLRQAKYSEHVRLLSLATETSEDNLRILSLQRAQALHGLGETDNALILLDGLLSRSPSDSDALLAKARVLNDAGETDNALDFLREATKYLDESPEFWMTIGDLELLSDNLANAESAFEKAAMLAEFSDDLSALNSAIARSAEIHLATRRYADADKFISRLEYTAPDNLNVRLLRGRYFFLIGDIEPSFRVVQTVLSMAPEYPPAQFLMGVIQSQRGNLAQSEMHLTSVVANDPDNVEARKALARLYLQLERPTDATRLLSPVLEAGAASPELVQLALQASSTRDGEDLVLRILEEQVEETNESPKEVLDLVAAYLSSGRTQKAEDLLGTVSGSSDEDLYRRDLMEIVTSLRADGPESAIKTAERVAEDWPEDVRVRTLLARLMAESQQFDSALSVLASAESLSPGNRFLALEKARVLMMKGELDQARDSYTSVVDPSDISRTDLPILITIASLAAATGERDTAIDWLSMASDVLPDSTRARSELARLQLVFDDVSGAEQTLLGGETTIDFDELSSALLYAELKIESSELDAAIGVARELQRRFPDTPDPLVLEAEALALKTDFNAAFAQMSKANSIEPDDAQIALRAYQLGRQADQPGVDRILLHFLAANPEVPRLRLLLASEYMAQDRNVEAAAQYEAVLDNNPNEVMSLNNLAWLKLESGDKSALDYARRAYNAAPGNSSVMDTLGWTEVRMGDPEVGLNLLREANKVSPENGQIAYHLAAALARNGEEQEASTLLEELLESGRSFTSLDEARELAIELR